MTVKLNKDINLGETGSVTTGNTVVNNDGVKVGDTTLTTSGLTITNGPSVTTAGIDGGSKQITNVSSGSDGVDADGNPTYNNLTNGANIGDIKNITDAAKTELTNDGLNFTADSGDAVHRNLGETLNIAGDGNITTTSDATNGKITVGLSNTVAVGESGSEDGSLTVNGADGSAVAIDGSNGSIALNTGSGSPVTIQAGISVNDVTGSPINRITVGGATVATLNDGMKYGGDFGTVSNVKLNNQVDVKGEATTEANLTSGNIGVVSSQNGDNGLLVVKLNKDLNLGENGSVTTGNTVINNSGVTIGSGDTAVSLTDGGLNNGGNKITNVATGTDGTDAVNVAQLEDRLSQITIGESKTTEVTVEGGTEAPTDGTYAGDNLQVKAGTTANGSPTYDVKLADNITLGSAADSAAGTTGTDGSITLNGANGSSVAVNGANGSVTAKGTDGSAVAINGSNGSIELNTESGSPVTIQAGTSANNLAGTSVDRISVGGQTVATMSDGLKYAGDDGQSDTTKVIAKTLNEQLDIVGGADATKLTDNNIGVNNVNGQLKVQLVKDINLGDTGSVTVGTAVLGNQTVTTTNGVSQTGTYLTGLGNTAWDTSNPDAVTGRAATEDQLKAINDKVNAISTGTGAFGLTDDDGNKVTQSLGETIQVAGDGQNITTTADAENGKITVALSNDISIGAKDGDDGTDGVDGKIGVNGKDGSSVVINGKDGSIGLTGPAGADGTPGTTVTIKVADPVNNVSDTPVDRITVGDQTVATLTDGMKYGGDFGTVSKVKLNNQVNVKGEATTEANLTTGNIGVVSSQDGDNGLLTVKLNKDINLGDTGSVKTGATVINNDGVTITPSTGKPVSLTGTGLNNGGNTITNVAAGTADTDAVNYGQLKAAATAVTVEGGTAAGTTDYAGNNLKLKATTDGDKTTYDLKLADKITLGSAADSAAGTEGTDSSITVNGKDGSAVAINGADGSIALNTADGSPVTIKAGTAANDVNGNSINRVTVGGATVATLDDGMKYTGDTGSAAVKLNKTVNIVGGETDSTKLSTDNNIGIVAEQDGDNGKLTVRLAKDITGLNTVTAGDATIGTQTEMTASGVAQTGSYVTGLDNTTWNVSDPDIVSGRAATEDQLKTVSDAIMDGTSENATGGFGLTDDSGNAVKQDLGKTIQIAGDGQNITTTADATNGKITVALSNDISIGAKDGADGTDGVDGKIGVNGKDGSAVVINGADGSIGLTGPAGADGTPGTTVTIKVADPVNDVTGTPIDRITVGGATVATLDDGMKYGGDFGTTSAVKLNNQVNVKGNATTEANLTDGNIGVVSSQDGDNGLLTVKLNKDINLGDTGSVKTGATVINNDGVTITPSTGNPVTLTGTGLNNGGNKITNVAAGDVSSTSTDAVNGSQLKAVQDIAEKHTVVTVEDGTAAGTTDYTGNNLKLKATEVDGQTTYDLKLADNLTIGAKDGTNGSIGVNGSDGNVVTIDGNDGISIKGADGKDGVSITGKDGVDGVDGLEGHIGLNGKDGVTDIYTTPGDAGVNGADGDTMTRIIYTDPEGTNHQVATLDDGMKYTGDTGSAAVKLNKTVNIVGGETDSTKLSTDNNIGIVAEQDNDNAKLTVRLAKDITGLNTVTAGDATIGNQTEVTAGGTAQTGSYVTGLDNTEWNMTSPDIVSGRAATEDQLKTVSDTVNALADGTSENATGGFGLTDDSGTAVKQDIGKTIQIAGDGNITTTADATSGKLTVGLSNTIALGEKASEDGSTEGTDSSITVNGKDGSAVAINGADGTIALNTADGSPVTIGAGTQVNNLAGTPIDRITIGGATVATLDDGMKYYGDFGEVASVKLNNQVNMEGEATSEDDLTTGNIGVVSSQDGDNALLTVKLNKDINLGSSGSVTTGNTVINNSGVTITPTGGNPVTLTDAGLNNGGNKIINVAPGAINDDSMDAVNGSQLNEIRKLAAQHTYVTVEGGTEGEAAEYAGKNLLIQTKRDNNLTTYYDLKLSDNITLGSANDDEGTGGVDSSITLNGADGSSVAIDGATGSVALTGTDGSTATIAAGTQANNLVGTAIDRITAGGSTVATLDDGMKYGGDFGTASAVKLNNQVNVKGNATTEADLTDGNIGVVSSQDGDNGLLTVKLNKDINLGDTGSVTIGNTVVNNSGVAIGSGDTAVTLTDKGLNNGGNQITNVASGTTGTTYDTTVDGQENYNNAANIGDLTTAINDVKGADKGGGFGLTADDGKSVKQDLGSTITVTGDTNIETKVTDDGKLQVGLKDNVDLGQDGSLTAGNTTIDKDGVSTDKIAIKDSGISIDKDGINAGNKQIKDVGSGLGNNYDTSVEGQENYNNGANIGDVYNIAKGQADAVKAQSGKNITVDADNKVNLNDNTTLGDNSDASKQVNIDGNGATVTAGSGDNQVKLDGSKGQISAGGAVLGNQANTANDGNPATGNYLTGLDNTTWDGTNIQSGRAATEDQLKVVDDKVSKGRVFQGDDGADNSVTVGLGDTLKLNGGADTSKLSSGNIGVVRNSSGDGLDIKLSKDLKDLDSVTTGNTTINNNGVTIKTVDSDRTITIQDSNVNMGNNVVSGVADGTVAPGSTEAVNGGQLALRDQAINNLGGEVNKLDNRINRVGAGAAALAALHPQDFDPDDKWDFAFGYGHYRGANAGAFGAFYKPNEGTTFSVGGTIGGGENMINAGVSFKLGQGNNVSNSRVGMAKEIKHLRDDVAKLEDIVNRQSQMINQLTGQNPGTIESKGSELFPDVPANHWAYEYVTKLHQLGIIEGYPDGNFDGNRMMTRYEFAAVVYRAIMAGAASNAALQGDDTLDRLANEFSAELKYIRIDTIAKDKDGKPTIQRVRIVPENKQN
ncbi:MAG: S-layer homology domain-containing protein [Megasphaera sp.]|nr:S-layer homology domain-containing protein [Megasphaera sp.]